jgi:hypothetical protein
MRLLLTECLTLINHNGIINPGADNSETVLRARRRRLDCRREKLGLDESVTYRTLVRRTGIIGPSADRDETNLRALQRRLDHRWGELGWELASISLVARDVTQLGGDHQFGQTVFIRCIRVFTIHARDTQSDVLHDDASSLTVNKIAVC